MNLCDVVILTDSRYVDPPASARSEYVNNILKEDQLVQQALEKAGVKVARKDWADPTFDWSQANALLFRTTWDYFDRYDEFQGWLQKVSTTSLLINDAQTIRWNVDKHYLQDLEQSGVHVIPTRYIERGSRISLSELHSITGWEQTVLKPTVGGAGRHTYKLSSHSLQKHEANFQKLIKNEDFMLQPFQHSVAVDGEWSYMFFGRTFSHAVLKRAKAGDFRVQDDFGGTVHPHTATEEEIEFALQALEACPSIPAYARVDVIKSNEGNPAVSELELIEPELWFRRKPEAADLLAKEVVRRVESSEF